MAVSAGHTRIVQLLLKTMESSYADRIVTNHVDENGEAPIHVAARCGSSEIMELLILHGANLGLVDGLGKTCLHCASQSGHASCLALALDSGADEYLEVLSHDGFTPLHFAVRSNKTECVKQSSKLCKRMMESKHNANIITWPLPLFPQHRTAPPTRTAHV